MGQKVNPHGFRLGPLYTWKSRWFAHQEDYNRYVLEDRKIRQFLFDRLKLAGLVDVEIERSINSLKIILYVSRPGVVIGRGGTGLEKLKADLYGILKIKPQDPKAPRLELPVEEVKKPDLSAQLVAQRLADQLEKRYPHRRGVAQAIEKVMNAGAEGIKIVLAGRIGGSEIARTEKFAQGNIPTQTLRADIDYAQIPALTKSGYIGVKVWIYKGEKEIK